jgi:hypothetical protein
MYLGRQCGRVYVIDHSSFREFTIQLVGHACFVSISRSNIISSSLSAESVIKGPPCQMSVIGSHMKKAGKVSHIKVE